MTEGAHRKPQGLNPGGEAGFPRFQPFSCVAGRMVPGRQAVDTVRKTFKEKLRPTPEQERQFELILWRCRTLYNTALEQRIYLWKQRGVSLTRYQ